MDRNDKKEVKTLSKFVSSDFVKNGIDSLINSGDFQSLMEFKIYLTNKIAYLMDKKYDLLMTTLYRIDIDETKIEKLFAGGNRDFIPERLAELIIERQLQKIRLREKYKSGEL